MISVLDRLATEFRDVQRSAESVAEPFACLQWRREQGRIQDWSEGGGGQSKSCKCKVTGAIKA